MPEWCFAGRKAFLSGLWTEPCGEPDNGRKHIIGAPGYEIHLCDTHFRDCVALDLITDIDISPEEFERRKSQ